MKLLKKIFLHICCLSVDVIGGLIVFLCWAFRWGTLARRNGVISIMFHQNSYPMGGPRDHQGYVAERAWKISPRGWFLRNRRDAMRRRVKPNGWLGVTLGHFHIYGPGSRGVTVATSTEVHEGFHTLQFEDLCVAATLFSIVFLLLPLASIDFLKLGIVVAAHFYVLLPWTFPLISRFVARLRDDSRGPYRGSTFEVAAYAVEDVFEDRGVGV